VFFVSLSWTGLFAGLRDIIAQLNIYTGMKLGNPNPTVIQEQDVTLQKDSATGGRGQMVLIDNYFRFT
jgi:hypothetical protein